MKVTLGVIRDSRQEQQQALQLPVSIKAKYWISRIIEKARKIDTSKQKELDAIIKDLGEQWVNEPKVGWRVAEPSDDVSRMETNWRVKQDCMPEFQTKYDEFAAQEIEISFDQIHIAALGETPIPFDINKLQWMFIGFDEM